MDALADWLISTGYYLTLTLTLPIIILSFLFAFVLGRSWRGKG